jgi:hypothetical protein
LQTALQIKQLVFGVSAQMAMMYRQPTTPLQDIFVLLGCRKNSCSYLLLMPVGRHSTNAWLGCKTWSLFGAILGTPAAVQEGQHYGTGYTIISQRHHNTINNTIM